jgi:2-oxoglutarate ferredoxin oxidoreductase subunit alpha
MDPAIVARENERILSKVYAQRELVDKWEEIECKDADILMLSVGSAARAAEEAVRVLRAKGVKAGLFRPVTLWPFPKDPFIKYADKAKYIVVPEMNLGQLKTVAERFSKRSKIVPVNLVNGEPISPEHIISVTNYLNV